MVYMRFSMSEISGESNLRNFSMRFGEGRSISTRIRNPGPGTISADLVCSAMATLQGNYAATFNLCQSSIRSGLSHALPRRIDSVTVPAIAQYGARCELG